MFGYIVVNQEELKIKEHKEYRSYYCGLCHKLKNQYGIPGQLTLTYDFTFLILLLADLYQDEPKSYFSRCVAHPFQKAPVKESLFTEYAADMNLLLAYYQCEDDWLDEKKLSKRMAGSLLRSRCQEIKEKYPKKAKVIEEELGKLHAYEKNGTGSMDDTAGCFGRIMEEIFVYQPDEWEQDLRQLGFYLGKFIYLIDAYEDVEKDLAKHCYNPLLPLWGQDSFEENCCQILTMMLSEACLAFERLPLEDHVSILRNILYSGVWSHFELTNCKRKEKNDHV